MTLLLDEHVSPAVVHGLRRSGIEAVAMREWREGWFREAADEAILVQAAAEGLVLVTYDQRTIPALLKIWAETGRSHGGVVFVDHRTIQQRDVGGLVRALAELHERSRGVAWVDRAVYLRRAQQ